MTHSGEAKDLKLSGFGILPSTHNLYISYFYRDLRSGQFRDLSINELVAPNYEEKLSVGIVFKG